LTNWRTDIENIHKDRVVLIWGVPEKHPHLEVTYSGPGIFSAYWDKLDGAFCLTGGDWLGPFIKPLKWAEVDYPD
jgi:hypothetical protein